MYLFYAYYIKRVLKFALFLQVVITISFAFLQMPAFLELVHGIKFNSSDILMILMLRIIEWINFITLNCFISALISIISYDISKHALLLSMIQLGYGKEYLLKLFTILTLFFSVSFLSVDMFMAPYSSYKIKVKLLEIAKNKFVSNLKPRHLIYYDNWSILIGSRINDYKIKHLLIDKTSNQGSLTFFIKSARFFSQDYMNLNLEESIGNIKFKNGSIKIRFKSGLFSAPRSIINVIQQERDKIFNQVSWKEIMRRMRYLIICFVLPFWFFVIFFGSSLSKTISIGLLASIVFQVIDVFPFNLNIILLCCLLLCSIFAFVYRKEK